jgi:hypothetical protein
VGGLFACVFVDGLFTCVFVCVGDLFTGLPVVCCLLGLFVVEQIVQAYLRKQMSMRVDATMNVMACIYLHTGRQTPTYTGITRSCVNHT